MIRNLMIIFTLMVISLSITLGQSTNKQIETEIQKLEEEYDQAWSKRDIATIDRLTTDDFTLTVAVPARVATKRALMERFKNSPTGATTIESSKLDDLQIRVYGDTAIAMGHVKEIGKTTEGKSTSLDFRFTDVWVRQNGKWLLAVSHASPANGVDKQE